MSISKHANCPSRIQWISSWARACRNWIGSYFRRQTTLNSIWKRCIIPSTRATRQTNIWSSLSATIWRVQTARGMRALCGKTSECSMMSWSDHLRDALNKQLGLVFHFNDCSVKYGRKCMHLYITVSYSLYAIWLCMYVCIYVFICVCIYIYI